MKDSILFGDCRDTISTITDKVQMCVTSPPYYGLRDYGGEGDQIGQVFTVECYAANYNDAKKVALAQYPKARIMGVNAKFN